MAKIKAKGIILPDFFVVSKEGQGLQPYQMQAIWSAIRQSGEVALANRHYQLDEMDKV